MSSEQIREERLRKGLCVECQGVPTKLYDIKRARFNPLSFKKTKLNVAGESLDGNCLKCHPHLDPYHGRTKIRRGLRKQRKQRKQKSKEQSNIKTTEEETKEPELEIISLEKIRSVVEDLSNAGDSDNTTNTLVQIIKEHSENIEIFEFCIHKIQDLCKGSEDYRNSMLSTGALNDILQATKTHFKNAVIQELVCNTIRSLCNTPESRIMLSRSGALAYIINVFVEHIDNEDVVSAGLCCLRKFSPNSEAREPISVLSGIDYVCKAMKLHSNVTNIQQDGCAILTNCAIDVEKQQVTLASDVEVEAITNAMFNHQNNPSVVSQVCFSITSFNHEERNVRRIRQVDGILELLVKITQYCEDSRVKEDAIGILDIFETSESNDYYLENQVLDSISQILVEDYRTMPDEKMRQVIGLMDDYEWSSKVFVAILQSLNKLCQQYPIQKEIVIRDQVVKNIITRMKKCADFAPIQSNGFELLGEIMKDDDSLRSMVLDMDGCEAVTTAMTKHIRNKAVQKAGRGVLNILSKEFPSEEEFECYMRTWNPEQKIAAA
eukprot:CAMPEP_0194139412 /NCGR_PEP_ID=MMETSP0152-20130528/9046_1 /TAXON_ID=1049557 /ORGANISM="Thalassiothrix antarctica, Strain L6-D1" /LENGTH=548 /DNA_ID=CAMNT_0038837213 /DNA_START=156 /DNA_END=1802 /DNA_ORIENTATION=-